MFTGAHVRVEPTTGDDRLIRYVRPGEFLPNSGSAPSWQSVCPKGTDRSSGPRFATRIARIHITAETGFVSGRRTEIARDWVAGSEDSPFTSLMRAGNRDAATIGMGERKIVIDSGTAIRVENARACRGPTMRPSVR